MTIALTSAGRPPVQAARGGSGPSTAPGSFGAALHEAVSARSAPRHTEKAEAGARAADAGPAAGAEAAFPVTAAAVPPGVPGPFGGQPAAPVPPTEPPSSGASAAPEDGSQPRGPQSPLPPAAEVPASDVPAAAAGEAPRTATGTFPATGMPAGAASGHGTRGSGTPGAQGPTNPDSSTTGTQESGAPGLRGAETHAAGVPAAGPRAAGTPATGAHPAAGTAPGAHSTGINASGLHASGINAPGPAVPGSAGSEVQPVLPGPVTAATGAQQAFQPGTHPLAHPGASAPPLPDGGNAAPQGQPGPAPLESAGTASPGGPVLPAASPLPPAIHQPGTPVSPAAGASAAAAAPAEVPLPAQLAKPVFTLAQAGAGEHVMVLKVTPEELGPVTVRAWIGADSSVRVELFAASDAGKEALRTVMGELKRDLAGSGLNASLELGSRDAPGDPASEGFRRNPGGPAPDRRQGADPAPPDEPDDRGRLRPDSLSNHLPSLDVMA